MPVKQAAAAVTLALCAVLAGCGRQGDAALAEQLTGGDVKQGKQLIYSYNCGSCHMIPGVAEAHGTVGPPLLGFARRDYISGSLANTPANLSHWIREPQKIEPHTAMPALGVTEKQATDIAAYLYTLQ